jgi:SAM-dependent methyltransferase
VENPGAADWAAARGAKWSAQAAGMEAMLEPLNDPLIVALGLDTRCRIVDVGCGGGTTAFEVLRRAPAGSVVHGYDISPEVIGLARGRVLPPDERALAFRVADMATAAPDEPYDRMVSRLGVMFFDDPAAAFANLAGWLAPGGRLAFAVWGPQSENPWMKTVRDVVADVIELPRPDPEAPGPFRYSKPAGLLALLDRAGLGELRVREWRGALRIGGGLPPAEAAHFALAAFSTFGELLAKAGDEALAEARRSLTSRFSQHQVQGAVQLQACVRIVTGARPVSS